MLVGRDSKVDVLMIFRMNGTMKCLNMYDVRLYDDMPACGMNWPPDLSDMYTYLHVRLSPPPTSPALTQLTHISQRKDVVSALHATETPSEWTECRGKIHQNFNTKHSNSSVTLLPKVLERIPVMLFVGDQDMICNYVGVENLIASLKWNGETGLGVSVLFPNTG